MAADALRGLRREKVAARGLEELQHRLGLKCRRIGKVNYHLRAGDCFFEPFPGDGVDATFGGRSDDLVAAAAEKATVFEPIKPVPPTTTIFMA
jgi:hypothetical protein